MKNLLTLAVLAALTLAAHAQGLNGKITSAEPKSPQFKWVALTTGTNVVASATNLVFSTATFYGYVSATNNAAPVANTNAAYLGFKDSAGTVTTAGTPAVVATITAGGSLSIGTTGVRYNLTDFYFVGTTGEKVLIVFEQ